jgi:phytoene synthase
MPDASASHGATNEIAALVRRHDPDRFLTALFAPPAKRDALFVLYAFNHELARAREAASEPTLALIRLQWWREVVEGARRRHPVAEPLGALLAEGRLDRADLLAVIDARETEAEPAIETVAAWRDYLLGSAGGLAVAAGRLLGAADPEALRPFGAAYGAAGVLRSVPTLARQGRCLLPAEALAAHGLVPEAVVSEGVASGDRRLHAALRDLAAEGRGFLAAGRASQVPRQAITAALPAVLARRDLASAPIAQPVRGLGDRLAVTWAGLRGRI